MIRLIAETATRGEHLKWYQQFREIITSPAHYLGEFTIETVFAVVGVHAIHKVAHSIVHAALRRIRMIGRTVVGRVR